MAARKAVGAGGVAQLIKLLNQGGMRGRGRRSSLSRWMRTHHDAFAAMLADKEPGWDEVAAGLAAMGLLDGAGKPPTGERARKAWWGVRRAKAAAVAKRQAAAAAPSLAPGEIAPSVYAAPAPRTRGAETPPPRMTLDIRPALPLNGGQAHPPAGLDSAARPSQPAQAGDAATETLRQLRQQMDANTVPLPKVVP